MTRTLLICALLSVLIAGCCCWPCNWADPEQPPGTRTVRTYGVLVDAKTFAKIVEGGLDIQEAAKLWHTSSTLTLHFVDIERVITKAEAENEAAEETKEEAKARAKKIEKDLIYEGLKIHFIEERRMFIMTGAGRMDFGDTIIVITDTNPVILTTDKDGYVITETRIVMLDDADKQPASVGIERKWFPYDERRQDAKVKQRKAKPPILKDTCKPLISKRYPLAQSRRFRPEISRKIVDITVNPRGKWWEGIGTYPGPKPEAEPKPKN